MSHEKITLVSGGSGWIHVKFSADITQEEFYSLFAGVQQLAESAGATDVLIDASAYKGSLTVMQRLQMVLAFVANLRRYRVAGILSAETVDKQKLGETMARNRGARVKIFTQHDEAWTWLMANRSTGSGGQDDPGDLAQT